MANVVVNSNSIGFENDEIVYPCKDSDDDKDKPPSENDCCCKTYNVVLHFH